MSELSSVNATNKDFNDRIEDKQKEIDYFRYLKQQRMINQPNWNAPYPYPLRLPNQFGPNKFSLAPTTPYFPPFAERSN